MHAGGCLCGAVRYVIDGALAPVQLCYCGQCRKAQGSAFAANIPVESASFRLTAGRDQLAEYRASPGKRRVFCSVCGSPIFSQRDDASASLRLRAGTLDEPVDLAIAYHFMVGSKARWWTISGDLPQHDELPPDRKPTT